MGRYLRIDHREVAADLERILARFPGSLNGINSRQARFRAASSKCLPLPRADVAAQTDHVRRAFIRSAPNIVEQTFDIITGIRDTGTTVLMVEQNALAALEMCDYAYLLESGSLALSGSGRDLVDNPHVRSAYLAG